MASLKKLKIGQVLYKTYRRKMGNTMMGTTEISVIKVEQILEDHVICSGRKYDQRALALWKINKPVLRESFTGSWYEVKKERKQQPE